MAIYTDFSNNLADISLGNYQRCSKIITTGQILPKWELRWSVGITKAYQEIVYNFQLVR